MSKRFLMVALTDVELPSFFWEKLSFDFEGMTAKVPMPALRLHDQSRIAGRIMRTWKEPRRLMAEGYFSEHTPDGVEIPKLLEEGVPFQSSVGIWAKTFETVEKGETVQVNGRDFVGPGTIWRQSEVREVSFVALGADKNTSAVIAAQQPNSIAALHLAAGGSAPKTFEDAVAALMRQGHDRSSAIRRAVEVFPALHSELMVRMEKRQQIILGLKGGQKSC